ncbi:MAG: c-type cytochrome [Acidimicrobiales bacterium]
MRATWVLVGAVGLAALSPLRALTAAGAATHPIYQTARHDAGTPNSDFVTRSHGHITSYGDAAITYSAPPSALRALGYALYLENCATCHGTQANGVPVPGTSGAYPNLVGLGPATIDFWIESGRMPAADPRSVQAPRRPPRLTHHQALAIAAWINSLDPSYPDIPTVHLAGGNVATGMALFALNCAACHTIEGDGDALARGTFAPSLRNIPATQVAEAIRTGPGNMPRFTGNLSDYQVRDIVKFVTTEIQHPRNPGGFGLGGLGPVAEGFVALLLGVAFLALIAFWVGERQ